MSPDSFNVSEAFAAAMGYHRSGRLQQAEAVYRQILAQQPNHAAAWHLLGIAHSQRGDFSLAVQHISRAIQLDGGVAAFHANLAAAHQGLRQLDEAEACYRRAIELQPQLAEAHHGLGTVLLAQGKPLESESSYRQAIARKADFADAHCNLGNALRAQGKLDEAAASYERAADLAPSFAEAHSNLGGVRFLQERLDEAVACYRRALEIKPTLDQAHNNLGLVLQEQGRLEAAAACFRRALELNPNSAEAYGNLGAVLHDEGRLGEASTCYRHSLTLKPNAASMHNNLGTLLQQQGKLDDAVACYRRAAELDPHSAVAHANLGTAMREQGNLLEAITCHRRALELQADYPAARGSLIYEMSHVCQWDGIDEQSRRVAKAFDAGARRVLDDPLSPFAMLALPSVTTAQQQLRCARSWAESRLMPPTDAACGPTRPHLAGGGKITVGYLSADFYSHAIAVMAAELFEKHDRRAFKIIGYSYGRDDRSLMRARLIKAFDQFVDIRPLSYVEAAQRIARDGVDILVDLTGYTKEARTRILAYRPAPIQVNFLGYVGTMGTSLVDYIVVDDFVVPPEMQPYYVEKLVHVPGSYMVNDSQRSISPQTPARAECGLPEAGFVFCSFNNNYKITPAMFDVWMRLLAATPGSVLWLLEGNQFAPPNLRREAESRGISPERLVFATHCPLADHLARHRQADLFLDTFPYNAHTTASDALWAGCPLVTLAGETFQSRVAGSLLHALGLPELVTWSLDQYEQLSMRLAGSPDELAYLRERLQAARHFSGVFDAEPFARKLEQAYITMHQRHVTGQEAVAFRVQAD